VTDELENVGPPGWLSRPWRGGAMMRNARAPRPEPKDCVERLTVVGPEALTTPAFTGSAR